MRSTSDSGIVSTSKNPNIATPPVDKHECRSEDRAAQPDGCCARRVFGRSQRDFGKCREKLGDSGLAALFDSLAFVDVYILRRLRFSRGKPRTDDDHLLKLLCGRAFCLRVVIDICGAKGCADEREARKGEHRQSRGWFRASTRHFRRLCAVEASLLGGAGPLYPIQQP